MRKLFVFCGLMTAICADTFAQSDLTTALNNSCISSAMFGTDLATIQSNCTCWAGVVSDHLTAEGAAKLDQAIRAGQSVQLTPDLFQDYHTAIRSLDMQCPSLIEENMKAAKLKEQEALKSELATKITCSEAFKTHKSPLIVEWICRPEADSGNAEAQYIMARTVDLLDSDHFYDPLRRPEKRISTFDWTRRSAEQGYLNAQAALGKMYAGGDGVAKDESTAAYWYELAANHDHALAQQYLAALYQYGRGVPRDYVQAYKWYSLALKNSKKLKKVLVSNLEILASKMSSAELEKANQLIAEWPTK